MVHSTLASSSTRCTRFRCCRWPRFGCYLLVFGITDTLLGVDMRGRMYSRQRLEVSDRPAGRDRLRGGYDRIGVDTIVPVKLGQRARLAEMFDAKRARTMAGDRAKPGERRRMAIEHADDAAMRRHVGEQALNMRAGVHEAALACPLRGGPAGIEPVGGGYGEQPHVAAVFRHQTDGGDRFWRDRASEGDRDLRIRSRPAQPISAVDDLLRWLRRHFACDLLDWPR